MLWNVAAQTRRLTLPIERAVYFAVFDPKEQNILVAGTEAAVRVWSAAAPPRVVAKLEGHSSDVTFATFLDEDIALTETSDGVVRVWDWRRGTELYRLAHPGGGGINWGGGRHGWLGTATADGWVAAWYFASFDGSADKLSKLAQRLSPFDVGLGAPVWHDPRPSRP